MMKKLAIAVLLFTTAMTGCKKDVTNPGNENEHDAINSVTLTLKQNGNIVGTFIAEDPDGDGGNPPTRIDTIRLAANQAYTMELSLKNITASGTKDITASIREQGRNHELFYLVTGAAVAVAKTDLDVNNLPIGFNTTWTTTVAGTGNVLIKLMHKPFIKAAGDSHTVGHTDLALTMPVKIQ